MITYGPLLQNAMDAAAILEEKGVSATVLRLLTLEPLPLDTIAGMISETRHIVIMEEACSGGVGDALAVGLYSRLSVCRVDQLNFGHQYVTHGSVKELYQHYRLDGSSVAKFIMEVRSREN